MIYQFQYMIAKTLNNKNNNNDNAVKIAWGSLQLKTLLSRQIAWASLYKPYRTVLAVNCPKPPGFRQSPPRKGVP